jgi:D-aspartate ligase
MKIKDKELPYVVYVGLDSFPALATIRHLSSKGIPVIGIAQDKKDHNCKTNSVKEIIYTDKSSEELIITLEKLGEKFSQKAVLITGEEPNVLVVSRYRERIDKYYHIIMPEKDFVEKLVDKILFIEYAQKTELPIPRSFIIKDDKEIYCAGDEISYPAILKPTIRSPKWVEHTKKKAFKVESKTELVKYYEEYKNFGSGFLVQEWIEGPDTNHYTCNLYFNRNSELLVTFVSKKIRQWPPETGQGSIGIEARNDTVLNETINLFSKLNWKGLGYLDMKFDDRLQKYLIVEPNILRPTGRSTTAEAGGVELIYTMYCDAAGLPLPQNRVQNYGNAKWVHLRRDFQAFLYHNKRGELTFKEWRNSLRGKKSHSLFSLKDPLPFIFDIIRVGKLYMKERNYV